MVREAALAPPSDKPVCKPAIVYCCSKMNRPNPTAEPRLGHVEPENGVLTLGEWMSLCSTYPMTRAKVFCTLGCPLTRTSPSILPAAQQETHLGSPCKTDNLAAAAALGD